jgi:hypothetical protein
MNTLNRRQTIGRYLDGMSWAWIALAFGRPAAQVYPPGMEELYQEIQRLQIRFQLMANHRTRESWTTEYMRERTDPLDAATH